MYQHDRFYITSIVGALTILVFMVLLHAAPSRAAVQADGSVTIVIDYGTNVLKTFLNIPWQPDLDYDKSGRQPTDLITALETAQKRSPGLVYQFESVLTDRTGAERGRIVAVDGIQNKEDGRQWYVFLNGEALPEIQKKTTVSTSRGTGLTSGDTILLKYMDSPSQNTSPEAAFPYVVMKGTSYFTSGPQQMKPPDGVFQEDTAVKISQDAGAFVLLETAAGEKLFVSTDALTPVDAREGQQEETRNTVLLVVDFNNGVIKEFKDISVDTVRTTDLLDVLNTAKLITPGLRIEFEQNLVTRGGSAVGSIRSIDSVAPTRPGEYWHVLVNDESYGFEIMSKARHHPGRPSIKGGQTILLTLSQAVE